MASPSPRPLALPTRLAETLIEGLGEALAESELPQGLVRRADTLPQWVDPASDAGPTLPSGLPALDALVGGGLSAGSFVEFAGPLSSGRTSCAHAWLGAATLTGHAAWVDLHDAFDPASAQAGGAALSRVLWVRAPEPQLSLRACERLLLSRAFGLVVLDLSNLSNSPDAGARREPAILRRHRSQSGRRARTRSWTPPTSAWMRLQRSAARTRTTLLLLSREALAGAVPALSLVGDPAAACFDESPAWFEGAIARVHRVRDRRRPDEQSAALPLALDPEVPPCARGMPADPRSPRRCDSARAS